MARATGARACVAAALVALALLAATVTATPNEDLSSLLQQTNPEDITGVQNPFRVSLAEWLVGGDDRKLQFAVFDEPMAPCPERAVLTLPATRLPDGSVRLDSGRLELDGYQKCGPLVFELPDVVSSLESKRVSCDGGEIFQSMLLTGISNGVQMDRVEMEFSGEGISCSYVAEVEGSQEETSEDDDAKQPEAGANSGGDGGESDGAPDSDPSSDDESTSSSGNAEPESSGGLGGGAIAGIGVGVGALALLALALLLCCFLRRKKAAGFKAGDRHSMSSASDVEGGVPPAPPSLSTSVGALSAGVAGGAATGAYSAEATAAAIPTTEEKTVTKTVHSPLVVAYDASVEPVSDADALRDGDATAGVGIGEDGALPLHVAIALDTSELACSADHDDGDVRSLYARALGEMLAGMGDDVSMSLVSFSGDEAKVVETGGRIRADVDAATEAVATVVPPAGARTSRATPKAAMRAVNACIGLLRETPADKRVAKRVLMVSGGGVEDGEMRELRAQANGGRGWKTANCVVAAAVGPLAKLPAAVQLGAVALDVADVEEFAKPEVVGLVKALFAADDPRSVK